MRWVRPAEEVGRGLKPVAAEIREARGTFAPLKKWDVD